MATPDHPSARLLYGLLALCGGNLLAVAATGFAVARGIVTQGDLEKSETRWGSALSAHAALDKTDRERIWQEFAAREAIAFREPDWTREQKAWGIVIENLRRDVDRNTEAIKEIERR